eukprot:TRINITY_DN1708_c0_g1_i1.p1 TRINITY_DN1708_c0_g1~~TRINITY_DN1708_c0_g1_i1.p1  ORF type:complete len:292 (+),score=81.80 TRINITY_DN1708_c0_g1_i1:109-876(+)
MVDKEEVKSYFKRLQRTRQAKEEEQEPDGSPHHLMTQASKDAGHAARAAPLPDATNLSPVNAQELPAMLPQPLKEHDGKICMVLDVDETLVHSSFKPVAMPSLILPVHIDGQTYQVYVLKRPFVDDFLRVVGRLFEPVVFTASLSNYADPLMDRLDPGRQVLGEHRLFREHCTHTNGAYVKDLSLLGRSLERVCIVDNSPVAYLFQPRNALPCVSWFDDQDDTELRDFVPILERLSECAAVYEVLDEYREKLQLR